MANKTKINWEELSNVLIDMLVEWTSSNELCEQLYESGYSIEQLEYLGFDEDYLEELKQREKDSQDDSMDAEFERSRDEKWGNN
jgi:hypothetical protein